MTFEQFLGTLIFSFMLAYAFLVVLSGLLRIMPHEKREELRIDFKNRDL